MTHPKDTESATSKTAEDKDTAASTPDGLRVLNASLEDVAAGRFTEFEL